MNTNHNAVKDESEIAAAYAEIRERGNALTLDQLIGWDKQIEERWGKVRGDGAVRSN